MEHLYLEDYGLNAYRIDHKRHKAQNGANLSKANKKAKRRRSLADPYGNNTTLHLGTLPEVNIVGSSMNIAVNDANIQRYADAVANGQIGLNQIKNTELRNRVRAKPIVDKIREDTDDAALPILAITVGVPVAIIGGLTRHTLGGMSLLAALGACKKSSKESTQENVITNKSPRVRENTSPTKERSEYFEDLMYSHIKSMNKKHGVYNTYPIPYIPEKSILINGSTTSTNVLDSIVKYAGIHNRKLKLAQHPSGLASKPRTIEPKEAIGLASQETHLGAIPALSTKKLSKEDTRAAYNMNYLTAFDTIPAHYLFNNYYWATTTDHTVHPILEGLRYYSEGDYNRGDTNHKKDVQRLGEKIWKNPAVKEWWEKEGKRIYETGK